MTPTEQVVVRASGPEDIIALVTHTLGFRPCESLVLVSLRGPRRRSGLVLRVDVAGLLRPAGPWLAGAAAQLVAPIAGDGASAAFVLVCSDAAGSGPGGVEPVHRALTGALEAALEERGVDLEDAVLVDRDRLYSMSCDAACCPAEGRPLGDVASTVVGAEMVSRGRAPVADRAAVVAALLAGVSPGREPADEAARREVAAAIGPRGRPRPGRWSPRPVREWFAVLDATAAATGPVPGRLAPRTPDEAAAAVLDPRRAAALLQAVDDDLLVRDALLASVVPGARADLLGSAFDRADGLRGRLAMVLARMGTSEEPGDPGLLDAAEAVVRRLARLAPEPRRAQPLAVLAYWGWWRGSTVDATVLADEALRLDPEQSLAALVLQLAERAVAPDWVRAGRVAAAGPARARGRAG